MYELLPLARPLAATMSTLALTLGAALDPGPRAPTRPTSSRAGAVSPGAASPGPPAPLAAAPATGCVRHGAALRTHGWRGRRTVALTFDDGPWPDTAAFLRVLERRHVRATFFQVGRQVRGQDRLERRILRDGDAIGNHTLNHPSLPAVPARVGQELSLTSAIIHHTSGGYRPCLFRPPYGAYNSAIVQRARADGMTTVIWDVDPRDWSRPGSRAIESRVMAQVRSGSIVLMHDGGGPREQTLSALPRIIGDLRRRGYGLVTVPELLGYRTRHG